MSRLRLRDEPLCLNCSAELHGRYCHQCGQENTEPHESFWIVLHHFIADLLHFDGKFLTSLKYLLFKPGWLSREYIRGKRASHFNPIRMYLFTSAVFFLLIFSFNSDNVQLDADTKIDSSAFTEMSVSAYDSTQQALPAAKRDGRLLRWLNRKFLITVGEYKGRETALIEHINERFIDLLPPWMMISLPIFSFILTLLYIRNKKYYFSDHFIFTLHLYIAQYIQLIILTGLLTLHDLLHWEIFNWLAILTGLYIFLYLYKALRNFYLQSRGKTILKLIIILLLMIILSLALTLAIGLQALLF